MRFVKVPSRACKQHSVSGRSGVIFSLCSHRRKDDIPLDNAPSSVATSA